MLLSLIVACASSVGGSNLGSGGERFDPNQYVPDDSTTETTTTTDTDDTGTTTEVTVTSEPTLLGLELSWGTDADSGGYLDGLLTYFDNPDDVMGGTLYLTIEQNGETLASDDDYDVVEPDAWDPPDDEAANDADAGTVLVRFLFIESTYDADVSVVLKDSAGHRSAQYEASITAEEETTK